LVPDVHLRFPDGLELMVRPIVPEDRALLRAGFEQLSDRSRYQRFLAPTSVLSNAQLAYLTEVDQSHHVALGVLHGGVAVGLVRMVLMAESAADADVAVTVADEYHGKGIGSELLRVLARVARHRGVTRLHFDVLAENSAMLRILGKLPVVEKQEDGAVLHLVVDAGGVPSPDRLEGSIETLVDVAADQAREASSRSRNTT
jgi:GNAT superfamily N-acetyltransferase